MRAKGIYGGTGIRSRVYLPVAWSKLIKFSKEKLTSLYLLQFKTLLFFFFYFKISNEFNSCPEYWSYMYDELLKVPQSSDVSCRSFITQLCVSKYVHVWHLYIAQQKRTHLLIYRTEWSIFLQTVWFSCIYFFLSSTPHIPRWQC